MRPMDRDWLMQLGMPSTLPTVHSARLLQFAYETLEFRVGETIASGMSDAQLNDFLTVVDAGHDDVVHWLSLHAPHYRNVVREQLSELELELRTTMPHIVSDLLSVTAPSNRAGLGS